MNTTIALEQLSGALKSIESTFGVDACIEYCEKQYTEKFRSEGFPLSKILSDEYSLEEAQDELVRDCVIRMFMAANTYYDSIPNPFDPECDEMYAEGFYTDLSEWEDANAPLINELKAKVNHDTLVVEITNYKGEGEGIALLSDTKNLRIFRGKFFY